MLVCWCIWMSVGASVPQHMCTDLLDSKVVINLQRRCLSMCRRGVLVEKQEEMILLLLLLLGYDFVQVRSLLSIAIPKIPSQGIQYIDHTYSPTS